jgi:hypothetical protein
MKTVKDGRLGTPGASHSGDVKMACVRHTVLTRSLARPKAGLLMFRWNDVRVLSARPATPRMLKVSARSASPIRSALSVMTECADLGKTFATAPKIARSVEN